MPEAVVPEISAAAHVVGAEPLDAIFHRRRVLHAIDRLRLAVAVLVGQGAADDRASRQPADDSSSRRASIVAPAIT